MKLVIDIPDEFYYRQIASHNGMSTIDAEVVVKAFFEGIPHGKSTSDEIALMLNNNIGWTITREECESIAKVLGRLPATLGTKCEEEKSRMTELDKLQSKRKKCHYCYYFDRYSTWCKAKGRYLEVIEECEHWTDSLLTKNMKETEE